MPLSFDYNRNQNENFNDGIQPGRAAECRALQFDRWHLQGWTFNGKFSQPLGDSHSFVTGWDITACATKKTSSATRPFPMCCR